jgi:hypothetical protein
MSQNYSKITYLKQSYMVRKSQGLIIAQFFVREKQGNDLIYNQDFFCLILPSKKGGQKDFFSWISLKSATQQR